MKEWEDVFFPRNKAERDKLNLDQFRWHIFSGNAYPSLDGENAIKEYEQQVCREFYVIPERSEDENEIPFKTRKAPPGRLVKLQRDVYVFPKNLAWTFAFTHEAGWLGPYFAKNRNYDRLNGKNVDAFRAINKKW